jgi:hypothetical protein
MRTQRCTSNFILRCSLVGSSEKDFVQMGKKGIQEVRRTSYKADILFRENSRGGAEAI